MGRDKIKSIREKESNNKKAWNIILQWYATRASAQSERLKWNLSPENSLISCNCKPPAHKTENGRKNAPPVLYNGFTHPPFFFFGIVANGKDVFLPHNGLFLMILILYFSHTDKQPCLSIILPFLPWFYSVGHTAGEQTGNIFPHRRKRPKSTQQRKKVGTENRRGKCFLAAPRESCRKVRRNEPARLPPL